MNDEQLLNFLQFLGSESAKRDFDCEEVGFMVARDGSISFGPYGLMHETDGLVGAGFPHANLRAAIEAARIEYEPGERG